ncbi:MAG: hypothetical protein A2756_04670 [Candidatus Ryanbacteria bacterium RIFCSPHIGHO2_01_FULL_48_27]|uniref:Teneurin-like YD-shell domain-containing protein n=1 Tax=Candidatus Ryanbacteria bacterium RIFCSPHIGHO2_01_FULL_48_27 TaxID=1802115 RepID=A0A1G2G457_9BACT|nr:MAG: hypothetical protein A2756_04670 [Candidatus Ryanbacteria bacterium RIFCSPHIGHO2_01_FULL_48_27]
MKAGYARSANLHISSSVALTLVVSVLLVPFAGLAGTPSYTPSTQSLEYTYSDTGFLIGITYADGTAVSYTYAPNNKIRSVLVNGAKRAEIYYGLNDLPVSLVQGAITTTYTYDPDLQNVLSLMQTSDGSINTRYTYDAIGNIIRIVDTGTALPKDAQYEYNLMNRLSKATITANGNTTIATYTYSPSGNTVSSSPAGIYEYNDPRHPHAVTRVGATQYRYDQTGNLVEKSTADDSVTYTYDYLNRLSAITKAGAVTTYTYDDSTNRIQKRLPNGARLSYFGREMELDEQGIPTNYVFANDARILTLDPTQGLLYNIQDHLGSASLVFKDSTLIQKLDYDPFGTERINNQTTSFSTRHTFTDKELDAESGLHYFGARYYDARMGRFTQSDPANLLLGSKEFEERYQRKLTAHLANPQNLNSGRTTELNSTSGFGFGNSPAKKNWTSIQAEFLRDPQMQNSYSYARNNPINMKDPEGLWGAFFQGDVSGAAGLFSGFAGQGSVGGGLVTGGNPFTDTTDIGGYTSYGGLVGGGWHSTTLEGSVSGPNNYGVFGASGGVSGGVTFTNATRMSQLQGRGVTNTLTLGIGSISWSVSKSGVWTISIAAGLEPAISFSVYPTDTNTKTVKTFGEKDNKSKK